MIYRLPSQGIGSALDPTRAPRDAEMRNQYCTQLIFFTGESETHTYHG